MTAMAPRSSTTARLSRKIFNDGGTRFPSRARTPSAKAMSVAIGMPQPLEPTLPALAAVKMSAGRTIPPTAAIAGSAATRRSRKSPVTSSRLISRPTTRKNRAISASLTKCCRSSWIPMDPIRISTELCQNRKYVAPHGELAHARPMAAATTRTMPPAASVAMNRRTGAGSVRGAGRRDVGWVVTNAPSAATNRPPTRLPGTPDRTLTDATGRERPSSFGPAHGTRSVHIPATSPKCPSRTVLRR